MYADFTICHKIIHYASAKLGKIIHTAAILLQEKPQNDKIAQKQKDKTHKYATKTGAFSIFIRFPLATSFARSEMWSEHSENVKNAASQPLIAGV